VRHGVGHVFPLALLLLLAACGGDGGGSPADVRTERVETTRVEVIEAAGAEVGFDPGAIYERESAGVVTVLADGLGVGSGFVLSANGEVVTNAHVVTQGEGARIREAEEVYVRFKSRDQVPAEVLGFDPFSDVALLKVSPRGLSLRPLPLGTTKDARVGEPVVAIGSPFGEEQSLSVGVVSALDRAIESLTGFDTVGAIQTDAAINQGNSGGPLLDARGRVLGINSQIKTASGAGSGVGFAVPADVVRRSVAQIRRTGRVEYAYLGVATSAVYPQLAERFELPVSKGAWVQEVVDGGPADRAGLRGGSGSTRFQARVYATGGDVITAIDDRPIKADTDLSLALVPRRPGETVVLRVARGDRERDVRVRLGRRPLAP
jgi:S1-C subfamily serine protease